MDHIVYLDAKADESGKLFSGEKSKIIRGAAGRKLPYGRVEQGDTLYFVNNNGEGTVKASATVKGVFNSPKMTKEESLKLVEEHSDRLALTPAQHKRWAGKRYLVIIDVENVKEIEPFGFDKSNFGNMDDWLPVGNIEDVRL